MRVIDEQRFEQLCRIGDIKQSDCQFLDGIKIGLRIVPKLLKSPSVVDARYPGDGFAEILLGSEPLRPGEFYLASTVERISVCNRIFGQLHTRSRWARVGLDCVGSSTYLSPGFGGDTPTPLVLEIRAFVTIEGIQTSDALGGLVLFELDTPVATGQQDHSLRFPLDRMANTNDKE